MKYNYRWGWNIIQTKWHYVNLPEHKIEYFYSLHTSCVVCGFYNTAINNAAANHKLIMR